MKIKAEITTRKSFYRITSGQWRFYWRRYYYRFEAKSPEWLIWNVHLGFFGIDCWALTEPSIAKQRLEIALKEQDRKESL